MKSRMAIYMLGALIFLSAVRIDHLEAHQEAFQLMTRSAGDQFGQSTLEKTEIIYYTGFEPGDPLGTNVDYNGGSSPDEWHVTTEMLYHGTTTWMTTPEGSYFCHIGDDSSGYSDGNEVGYQIYLDLSDYSDAYFYYLSAMQAYSNSCFDKFVVWGQHEGMGSDWINLDPGGGYAWGGDWGPYWYVPMGDSISLEDLVGHPEVTIEFWFFADCGSPEGFGVAIDEIIITGMPIPTAVMVSSFEAITVPDRIILRWTTASEKNNLGFHLLRRNAPEEPLVQLNEALIPAASGGNSEHTLQYQFVDHGVVAGRHYEYQLQSVDCQGERTVHGPVYATAISTNSFPEEFCLSQNYPNPFNPETEIRYQLPQDSHVVLEIFDVLGQKIRTLICDDLSAGAYSARWDGRDIQGREVSAGIYFCTLKAGDFTQTRKMVLLR